MTASTYDVRAKARNIRLLFLVDIAMPSDALTALICENQKKWGGKFNPVIPVRNAEIAEQWREFAKHFDPDFIYHSSTIGGKVVHDFAQQMGYRQAEIEVLDHSSFTFGSWSFIGLKGIYSMNLLSLFNHPMEILVTDPLNNADSELQRYFKLNYGADMNAYIPTTVKGGHNFHQVTDKNFAKLNKTIYEHRTHNNVALSTANASAPYFKTKHTEFFPFELIIGKDGYCNDELIYHWNRSFYELSPQKSINTLFLTDLQLDLLLTDKYFRFILDTYSGNEKVLKLVSFSLSEEILKAYEDKLSSFVSGAIHFRVAPKFDFPFGILHASAHRLRYINEKEKMNRFNFNEFLINIPQLTFEHQANSPDELYAVEIDITEVKGYMRNKRKFPFGTTGPRIFNGASRVNKSGNFVALIDNDMHFKGVLDLQVPDLVQVVGQLISRPVYLDGKQLKHHYLGHNEPGKRLHQFFRLFDNGMYTMRQFLNDGFWFQLFLNMADNVRIEGDTITFKSLFELCISEMKASEYAFQDISKRWRTVESLKLGITKILQELVDFRVFLPGFIIKCNQCSSKIWYSIKETDLRLTCKGCSGENVFKVETDISYKLNHLIKNNFGMRDNDGKFAPDGNMTVIRTILSLANDSPDSFEFTPQLDVFQHGGDGKPKTDLDIVVMSEGKLIIGECKHNSKLFSEKKRKSLENLLEIAEMIHPDKVLLSCSEDANDRLKNEAEYLRNRMKNWNVKPEVTTIYLPPPKHFTMFDSFYFPE